MQKEGQSSRQFMKSHLMTIMGVDIVKATQLVDEMEQVGLIRFVNIRHQSVIISSPNFYLRVNGIRI